MCRIFLTPITVTEENLDINQHVNNLAYLRWMQDAATAHSAAQGWPFERYASLGSGWFVRSHFIEYLQPAFLGDALLLYTWVHDISSRSSPRRYLFLRETDGGVIASAETLWAFVNFATGKLVRIPKEVASAFPIVSQDDPDLITLTRNRRHLSN